MQKDLKNPTKGALTKSPPPSRRAILPNRLPPKKESILNPESPLIASGAYGSPPLYSRFQTVDIREEAESNRQDNGFPTLGQNQSWVRRLTSLHASLAFAIHNILDANPPPEAMGDSGTMSIPDTGAVWLLSPLLPASWRSQAHSPLFTWPQVLLSSSQRAMDSQTPTPTPNRAFHPTPSCTKKTDSAS